MKRILLSALVAIICISLFSSVALADYQWSGTLNLKVVADSSSSDGKAGVYSYSGIIYRDFNYSGLPDGYVEITGHGADAPTKNMRGALFVRVGGEEISAGDYVWIPPEVGSFKKLPIKEQYRDNPDISFRFGARANTSETIGTHSIMVLASAAWDLGR